MSTLFVLVAVAVLLIFTLRALGQRELTRRFKEADIYYLTSARHKHLLCFV